MDCFDNLYTVLGNLLILCYMFDVSVTFPLYVTTMKAKVTFKAGFRNLLYREYVESCGSLNIHHRETGEPNIS